MKSPTISIIIIDKDDRGIEDTLKGLRKQALPKPTEVIVVDASALEALADIRKAYPEVRWFPFAPADNKKTSIPEQRNFGVRQAHGDIIVFIDANCVPFENWLINLTAAILSGQETMAAGSVRANNPKTRVNLNPESLKTDYLSSSPTINLAFKKSVWEQVNGFDESFLFGSDVDFTWRCTDAGNRILFVRTAVVTHDWGTLKDEVKRSFKYGKARARLFKKHASRRKELFGDSIVIPIYTVYLAALPLTIIFPWYPLTILAIMAKNIGGHPVKTVGLNMVYTLGAWREFVRKAAK